MEKSLSLKKLLSKLKEPELQKFFVGLHKDQKKPDSKTDKKLEEKFFGFSFKKNPILHGGCITRSIT